MRRVSIVVLFLSVMALAAQAVSATEGAHFDRTKTSGSLSGSTLTITFKAAGLGDITSADVYVFSGQALCINGGNRNPSASNKSGVAGGTTVSVQNGQATGSFTAVPSPSLHCGSGQTVEFRNVVIGIVATGASKASPLATDNLGNFS